MIFISRMNDIHSHVSIKGASPIVSACQFFRSLLVCKGWIKLVLCPSMVGMVIGSNIVSVCRSSKNVLWYCLYVVLYWETNANLIVSEYKRKQQIYFKEIMTPHETRHSLSLTNLFFFSF